MHSRIHRHHLVYIVVEMLLHERHEHHGLDHHLDLLVPRVVALRHVVRPPDAEEHRAEIVLQRPRLRLGNDVRLEDEVAHRRAAGIETAILHHDDSGRVAIAVGEGLEHALANLSRLEEDAALVAVEHRPVHDLLRALVGEKLFAVNGYPPLADSLDGVRDDVYVVLLRRVHAAQVEVRLRAVVVLHLAVADAPPRPRALRTVGRHPPLVAVFRGVQGAVAFYAVFVQSDTAFRHPGHERLAQLLRLALHARPVVHQLLQYALVGV